MLMNVVSLMSLKNYALTYHTSSLSVMLLVNLCLLIKRYMKHIVAAEVISGKKHEFDPRCIPSIAYTDPEMAWVGVTEAEAKAARFKH